MLTGAAATITGSHNRWVMRGAATCGIYILLLFIGIAAPGMPASSVYSDNTTANVTLLESPDLESISTSMEELHEGLEEVVPAIVRLADSTDHLFEVFMLFGFIAVALWRKKAFINMAASLATFFMAIRWIDDYTGVSIALLSFACYLLYYTAYAPLYRIINDFHTRWRAHPWWSSKRSR